MGSFRVRPVRLKRWFFGFLALLALPFFLLGWVFKKKREEIDSNAEDAIQYRDKNRQQAFISVNLKGTTDNYSIALKKEKPSGKQQ